MFNTSRNKSSSPSVKTMQICPRIKWRSVEFWSLTASSTDRIYRDLKGYVSLMLDSFSIDKLSIEIYENHILSFDFTPICVYLFRLSFLTTLNIYKDYYNGRHNWCNSMQKFFTSILWLKIYAPVHFPLQEAAAFVRLKVL